MHTSGMQGVHGKHYDIKHDEQHQNVTCEHVSQSHMLGVGGLRNATTV